MDLQGKNSNRSQHRVESESEFISEVGTQRVATPQPEQPPLLRFMSSEGRAFNKRRNVQDLSGEKGGDFSAELLYGLSVSDHGGEDYQL